VKPRNDYRLKVNLPIKYKLSDKEQTVIKEGIAYDLSESGICFQTDTLLKEGQTLQINIPQIFNWPKHSSIRWCSPQPNGFYKVGILFSTYS
jgi:hypothetical protein